MPRCGRQRACPPRTLARCWTRRSPNFRRRSACSRRRWQPVIRQALGQPIRTPANAGSCALPSPRPPFRCSCSPRTARSCGSTRPLPSCLGLSPVTRLAGRSQRSWSSRAGRQCRRSSTPSPGAARPAGSDAACWARPGAARELAIGLVSVSGDNDRLIVAAGNGAEVAAGAGPLLAAVTQRSPRLHAQRTPGSRATGTPSGVALQLSPTAATGTAARRRALWRRSPNGWTW